MKQRKLAMIDVVRKMKSVNSSQHYQYHLTHTYDIGDNSVRFSANIAPHVVDLLLAYIQFECSDIDNCYSMSQSELMSIVADLYGEVGIHSKTEETKEIDLYVNWETWCSCAEEVQKIELFKRTELSDRLESIINEWKKKEDYIDEH